jgi:hypothetical protein
MAPELTYPHLHNQRHDVAGGSMDQSFAIEAYSYGAGVGAVLTMQAIRDTRAAERASADDEDDSKRRLGRVFC